MLKKLDAGLLLAFLIPAFIIAPLVQHEGIPNIADGVIHLLRQVDFDLAMRDGALVPRWGANLYAGFGYPLYVFAPPLLAYGVELFHLLGLAMDDALKLCVALTLELYSVGMFLLMRPKVGARGALIAAALSTYAPLRLREALVTGGNYPQFLAMALFAPTLWAFDGIVRTRAPRYVLAGALSYAALLLAHIFHAVVFTPLLIAYVLLRLWQTDATRSTWALALGAGALAVVVSAFFWLPALDEQPLVRASGAAFAQASDYHQRFLSGSRLLAPPQRLDPSEANADVPLSLGWVPLAGAALGVVMVALHAFRSRSSRPLLEPAFFTLLLLGSVYLQLPASARIWEQLSVLPVAEFPWRFMGLSVLALAVLSGYATGDHRLRAGPSWRVALVPLFMVAAILSALPYTLSPRGWTALGTPGAATVLAYEESSGAYGLTTVNEYLPQSVQRLPADMPAPLSASKLDTSLLPAGAVLSAEWAPRAERVMLRLSQATRVRFRTFNYPGWQAWLDGQPAPSITAEDGTIGVSVPAGEHRVETRFTSTPLRTASEIISVLGGLVLLGLVVASVRRRTVQTSAAEAQPLGSVEAWGMFALLVLLFSLTVLVLEPGNWLTFSRVMQPLSTFDGQIALLGSAVDEPSPSRGESLHVRFFWRATQPLQKDYHVFAQLWDGEGRAVAGSDKQHPGDPVVQGESPTSQLLVDKYLRDEHRVDIPATLRPGRYELRAGWYDPQTGQRLRLPDGETTVKVMEIEVR